MKQQEPTPLRQLRNPFAGKRPATDPSLHRIITGGAIVASMALASLLFIGIPFRTNAATHNQAKEFAVTQARNATPHLVNAAFAMPAPPAEAPDSAALIKKGKQLFQAHTCSACHGPDAKGTAIAPPLAGIGHYFNEQTFSALIHHPNAQMTAKGMPPAPLSDQQTHALFTYLNSMPVPAHPAPGAPSVVIFKKTAATATKSTIPPHAIAKVRPQHRTEATV